MSMTTRRELVVLNDDRQNFVGRKEYNEKRYQELEGAIPTNHYCSLVLIIKRTISRKRMRVYLEYSFDSWIE